MHIKLIKHFWWLIQFMHFTSYIYFMSQYLSSGSANIQLWINFFYYYSWTCVCPGWTWTRLRSRQKRCHLKHFVICSLHSMTRDNANQSSCNNPSFVERPCKSYTSLGSNINLIRSININALSFCCFISVRDAGLWIRRMLLVFYAFSILNRPQEECTVQSAQTFGLYFFHPTRLPSVGFV